MCILHVRLLELFETLQDQVLQLLLVSQCSGITFLLFDEVLCIHLANLLATMMLTDVFAYSYTHSTDVLRPLYMTVSVSWHSSYSNIAGFCLSKVLLWACSC